MLQVETQCRSVAGEKEPRASWKGVCFNIYVCFARLCTLWLISRKFWRVCHLKRVANPESDSGGGGGLTCSRNAHFMGEALPGPQSLLLPGAPHAWLDPGALFQSKFPSYFLFYFSLISQVSSHSFLKPGAIVWTLRSCKRAHTKTCTGVLMAILFIIARAREQPLGCPRVGEWRNKSGTSK